jgi:hypothetical protein
MGDPRNRQVVAYGVSLSSHLAHDKYEEAAPSKLGKVVAVHIDRAFIKDGDYGIELACAGRRSDYS